MIDRRTAKASAIFFAVALINPRDFPIENVPLIYPAFLLFWMQMGTKTMLQGFRAVKYLLFLLVGYQSYFLLLRFFLGSTPGLGDYAFVIEPAMILLAAAAAGVRPGGTKAATWVFVAVIAFSAAWGVGIYTVGEPFTTVRSIIQHSVGGTIGSGTVLREIDIADDLTDILAINSGLTKDVVIFGYELSAAMVLVVAGMIAKKPTAGVSYGMLVLAFVVLLAGIITNTERATVVAVVVGLIAFMFTDSLKRVITGRTIGFFVVGTAAMFLLMSASNRVVDRESLLKRSAVDASGLVRLYMSVPAIQSIAYQPMGAGGLSAHYEQVAFEVGWLTMSNGYPEAHSPHNHFAGLIMMGGVAGLMSGLLLFYALWKKAIALRRGKGSVYGRLLLAACVASIFHSFFHNAGFFGLVPPTQIAFGLLWGEMWLRGRPVRVIPAVDTALPVVTG